MGIMSDTIIHFLMFFGPLFAIIISIGQLVQIRKDFVDYIFSFSFFGMGLWMFQICLYSTGVFDSSRYTSYIVVFMIPLAFSVPPLMVLRYKWILSSTFQIRLRHLLLFLPAGISLIILLLPLFISTISSPAAYYPGLPALSGRYLSLPLYHKIVYAMLFLPNLYLVLFMTPYLVTMSIVWKDCYANKFSRAARAGYLFAASIVISNAVCVIGNLVSFSIIKVSILMANTATVMVYLVTRRNPDHIRLLQSESRKAQYEKSRVRGLDVSRIISRLHEIMADEKAFADEEITLKDLAQELGISPHQLSEILNEKIKKNFKTFVNEYRVEEAKKLLVEEPDRSILSVGVAVGFNSNTTFCTVFSKTTGYSPRHYRKIHT